MSRRFYKDNRQRRGQRRKTRSGVALLEFALVVPILLLLVLGIMEFGWYARKQTIVANATREGARVAAVGATQEEIRARVISSVHPITIGSGDLTLQFSTNQGQSYSDFPPDNTLKAPPENAVPGGALLQVSINVAHSRLINLPLTPARIATAVTIIREY